MDTDLRELLNSWPYDSEDPSNNYRRLTGNDGRLVIQVREPLGVQQMEYEGRPDGSRPHDHATWLEYYQEMAKDRPFFQLGHDDCQNLMQEGVLFYQRYLVLYQMDDWEGVARDTGRNLEYFDFLKEYARHREDHLMVEQYRPYVMRMNAVAKSQLIWIAGNFDAALGMLKGAVVALQRLEPVPTQVFTMELERSVKHLKELIGEFEKKRPEGRLEVLRREQTEAIRRQDFERAASIRDEIRRIEGGVASKN